MAVRVPLLLRRLRPALAHFVHSLPLALRVPGGAHGAGPLVRARRLAHGCARDGDLPLRRPALGAAGTAGARDLAAHEGRPRRALRARRRTRSSSRRSPPTPRSARAGRAATTCCSSGSIEPRKNPLLAAEAARVAGRKLVVVGPERDAALAAELRARGADVRGFVAEGRARPARPGGGGAPLPDPARGVRPARRRGDGVRARPSSRRPIRRCARSAATRSRTRSRASFGATSSPRARRPGALVAGGSRAGAAATRGSATARDHRRRLP